MRALIFFAGHVPLAIFLMNCGGDPIDIPPPVPPPSSGGSSGTGSGGTGVSGSSTGGVGGSGVSGSVGQSGSTFAGTAGTFTAGTAGVGQAGTPAAGGSTGGATAGTGTAGSVAAGTTSVGGLLNSGGSAGMPTGGAGGMSTVTCEAAFAVTMDGYVRAPVSGGGCWHGYAFAGGDASSTVTFPGGGTDFSKSMGVLQLTGTVGAATEENNYAGNVFFGVNLNQLASSSAKSTVTPAGASLVVRYSGGSGPPMRIQLQAPGGDTDATKRWCAPVTSSGTAIAYTTFKTECWDGGNQVAYAKQPIEAILITIPGGAMDADFDVTLTGIGEM